MIQSISESLIEDQLKSNIDSVIRNYRSFNKIKRFHNPIISDDQIVLHAYINAMTELFGKAIYEKLLLLYGASYNHKCIHKYAVGNEISNGAINEINSIIIELKEGKLSNKAEEIERLRAVCTKGGIVKIKPIVSDMYLQKKDNSSNIIFITTHSIDFPSILPMKNKLLRSIAVFLLSNPNDKVNSYFAVPNNPYAPSPYEKWILSKTIDNNEFLYGKEFWDFLGVDGTYEEVLFHFEKLRVGYRQKMIKFFQKKSYQML